MLIVGIGLLPAAAHAQAGPLAPGSPPPPAARWTIAGSHRTRYEVLDGQARAGLTDTDRLVSLRTIIAIRYAGDTLFGGVDLWDSRGYFGRRGGAAGPNDVNALEPVQAYVGMKLGDVLGAGTTASVQAGRFLLDLGSRRLVANDDYRNTTSGYAGLRGDMTAGRVSATVFYTLPQVRLPADQPSVLDNDVVIDRQSFDLIFWGGLAERRALPGGFTGQLAYYRLVERDRPDLPTRNRRLHTIDIHLGRDPHPGRFDLEVEAAYQFGTIRTGTDAGAPQVGVVADFLHVEAGWTGAGGLRPRLSLEFDRASGDGAGGRYGRFDTLFGSRRIDFAPSGIFAVIARTNLLSPGIRLEVAPSAGWDAMVDLRALYLDARRDAFSSSGTRDATGASGRFAGNQIDARVRYWLIPDRLRMELDGVLIAKGRFLRVAPNAPATGNARYFSASLQASF